VTRLPITVVAVLLALTRAAPAQCRVPANSEEARLLAYYAAPLTFSPAGLLEQQPAGSLRASLEVTIIPQPGDDLRRTSRCFQPKEENTQLSPVLPRPRFSLALPGGFVAEGSWLPPLTVADATPNLASLALALVRHLSGAFGFALRAHATVGHVRGPITCAAEALQLANPQLACYGSEPSEDTWYPNVAGGEAAVTWRRDGRASAYAGAGYSSLRPRFRVGFRDAAGQLDSTRVEADVERVTVMAGGRYLVRGSLSVLGEVYAVPEDVTLFRTGLTLRFR
jgi:hypothetical protein